MLSDKKLEKLEKTLGKDKLSEMESHSEETLKHYVVEAERAIKACVEELESNPKYQELKDQLKALSGGLRDVKKFQNAVISYSIHLLEEKGK